MADEQESGSVGQDAFSEEILAWMAAGDALATSSPEGAEELDDDPVAPRVSPAARRLIHLAVSALSSWWGALPVPRRRTAIAAGVGTVLLLGGLAASQASSPRATVVVAVAEAPRLPVPATAPASVAKPESLSARAVVVRSTHAAHPAHAKSPSRSPRKHLVVTVPVRR